MPRHLRPEQRCRLLSDPGSGHISRRATYQIVITIDDPGQTRWGFEFSPLNQGTCAITNPDSTQVSLSGGNAYVKHTAAGTNAGSAGPMSWSFEWTAPAMPSDTVFFYAAGNGANNNNRASGDYIYTTVAWTVLQDTEPPNAITDLSVSISGADLILTWTNPGDNVGVVDYLLFSSPVAFFSPAGPGFEVVSNPPHAVLNAVGDPAVNHFFNVLARDAAQNLSAPSNYVGELDFGLGR
ncbi:hypothetical protein JXA88_18795 [Candidatus Fermentibacteria bacterium]|nr:hypothetical protein [Candidatus Fermentibacteria bacterium]